MAEPLRRLAKAMNKYHVSGFVVHRPTKEKALTSALSPGIKALPADALPFLKV
jgi:hypothetical protein